MIFHKLKIFAVKHNINSLGTLLLLCVMTGACTRNFDSINSNPNTSTTSRADWLATSMLTSITSSDINTQNSFVLPFLLGKYVLWTQGNSQAYQYNKLQRTDFTRLTVLRNIALMNKYAASDPTTQNSYAGLGHFIRAWQFFQLSMQVGDIPYSDALKGESDGDIQPKYDAQKNVFIGILKELDQADSLFASGANFKGDFIYGGNVDKWRRLTNGFELHVLINLFKKTSDPDLKVTERFNNIVSSRPLMRDYTDNFAVTYINVAGSCYPWSSTGVQKNPYTIYSMVSSDVIDSLKARQDRRLFYYAEPAATKIAGGSSVSDFNAYVGVEPSAEYTTTTTARSAGNFSDFNKRYSDLYNAEPVGLFCYWDQEFILAEAAVRGWISGVPAQAYYANGIQGSMNFLANYTGAATSYVHGMALTAGYIANYPSTVALGGNTEDQVNQIITQKYLANFFQDVDFNGWYENRRTGYPVFALNPNTNQNIPGTQFPVRWMYPQNELDYNGNNVGAAIQSQYGGHDDVNQAMWLLK